MERKTLGILALALVGLLGVSLVAAMPFTGAENHEAIREAVEAGDYDAWKAAVTADLTEENFEKMTQMHELREQVRESREAGDMDTADALMEELKELMSEGPMDRGHRGPGQGFGKGMGRGHEGCPFAE